LPLDQGSGQVLAGLEPADAWRSLVHYPPDIDEAYEAFGANCGPCSLAALLHMPVMEVGPISPGSSSAGL
jgi:hypothetical protein